MQNKVEAPNWKDDERVLRIFKELDVDGSGSISREELRMVLQELDPEVWNESSVQELFESLDFNKDELIMVDELLVYAFDRQDFVENLAKEFDSAKGIAGTAHRACESADAELTPELIDAVLADSELSLCLAEKYMHRFARKSARSATAEPKKLWLTEVQDAMRHLARRLRAGTPPTNEEVFLAFQAHNKSATNTLLLEEFHTLCRDLIRHHLKGLPLGTLRPEDEALAALPEFEAVERTGQICVQVMTMGGECTDLKLDDGGLGMDLKTEVHRVEGTPVKMQKLLFKGRALADDLALYAMGVFDGSVLCLVRVPYVERVVVRELETIRTDCCWKVTCKEFGITDKTVAGRPMYQSDSGMWLFGQPGLNRWAIADTGEWSTFADNSWAWCKSDAANAGDLVGLPWHVCDRSYRNYPECPGLGLEVADT